ncbi:MAG: glycosyltransferase [Ginsengibacter sp.]
MLQGKKFNNTTKGPTILIAPLDWGLGHVTRCIPIIKELEKLNCNLIIAVADVGFLLLKKEFPSLVILPAAGYKIRYSKGKGRVFFKLILQLPKLAIKISKEHNWLKKIIHTYKPDVIISDNRLGLFNKSITSVYITHQLEIKTGNSLFDKVASKIHNSFIKKYDQCWIPDFKENGLAGELSHPKILQRNSVYLGALSRFEKISPTERIYDVLISISGPEPQRTIFEEIVLAQLKNFRKKVLIVRGLPAENKKMIPTIPNIKIVNHLKSVDLNMAFMQSDMIICRSGYTTIMDLVKLDKPAILIPTPGQAEQEYLAANLMKTKNFFSVKQKDFLLEESLLKASVFPYVNRNDNMEIYKEVIADFIHLVKSGDPLLQ